jgi:hypothetical protein
VTPRTPRRRRAQLCGRLGRRGRRGGGELSSVGAWDAADAEEEESSALWAPATRQVARGQWRGASGGSVGTYQLNKKIKPRVMLGIEEMTKIHAVHLHSTCRDSV